MFVKSAFWVQMSQNHKTYPCHVDWIWTIALLRFFADDRYYATIRSFPFGKGSTWKPGKTIHGLSESLQKIQALKQHLMIFYCCNTRTFNTWVSWSISKRQNSRASAPTTEYDLCWSSRQQISSSLQLSRDFGGFFAWSFGARDLLTPMDLEVSVQIEPWLLLHFHHPSHVAVPR